jgi:hypothetical protein
MIYTSEPDFRYANCPPIWGQNTIVVKVQNVRLPYKMTSAIDIKAMRSFTGYFDFSGWCKSAFCTVNVQNDLTLVRRHKISLVRMQASALLRLCGRRKIAFLNPSAFPRHALHHPTPLIGLAGWFHRSVFRPVRPTPPRI